MRPLTLRSSAFEANTIPSLIDSRAPSAIHAMSFLVVTEPERAVPLHDDFLGAVAPAHVAGTTRADFLRCVRCVRCLRCLRWLGCPGSLGCLKCKRCRCHRCLRCFRCRRWRRRRGRCRWGRRLRVEPAAEPLRAEERGALGRFLQDLALDRLGVRVQSRVLEPEAVVLVFAQVLSLEGPRVDRLLHDGHCLRTCGRDALDRDRVAGCDAGSGDARGTFLCCRRSARTAR